MSERKTHIQTHITEHELPNEVKDFIFKVWSEHLNDLEPAQLLENVNIRIPLNKNTVIIETHSNDFIYDREKGLEQFFS